MSRKNLHEAEQSIDFALSHAQEQLAVQAATEAPNVPMVQGEMDALLTIVARELLTTDQQQQVHEIIELHQQCYYKPKKERC